MIERVLPFFLSRARHAEQVSMHYRRNGSVCSGYIHFFFFLDAMLSLVRLVGLCYGGSAHLFTGSTERDSDWNVHQIIPNTDSIPPGEFQRSVVGCFQSFNDVPGLPFHDGHLSGEHAVFEIRVDFERSA